MQLQLEVTQTHFFKLIIVNRQKAHSARR